MRIINFLKRWFLKSQPSQRFELWLICADNLPELQIYETEPQALMAAIEALKDPFVKDCRIRPLPPLIIPAPQFDQLPGGYQANPLLRRHHFYDSPNRTK